MAQLRITAWLVVAAAVTLALAQPACAQRPNSQRAPSRRGMQSQVAQAQYEQGRSQAETGNEEMAGNECGPAFGPACCGPIQYLFDWSRCDLSIGATAFSNPTNFLTSGNNTTGQVEGNFGFQESFNFGSCLPGLLNGQVGGQIGLRAIQSQLNGNSAGDDARNQLFVTGGLFRRVDYGVQGGLVVDYLHDDWLAVVDLSQLRGELSFALTPCHAAGFRFTSSLNDHQSSAMVAGQPAPVSVNLTTLDNYRFYYACALGDEGRANAELNAGFTEDRDAVLGMTLSTPLHGEVGLSASTTYLIPHSGAQPTYATESWNIGLALVWTPGRLAGCGRDYYRPLLDVADNGSVLMKRQ